MTTVSSIGGYNITPMQNGKYIVAVNNGNYGARICSEQEVQTLINGNVNNNEKLSGFRPYLNPYQYNINANDDAITKMGKGVTNVFLLQPEQNLSGLELVNARLHNAAAAAINPFAAGELIKNSFNALG